MAARLQYPLQTYMHKTRVVNGCFQLNGANNPIPIRQKGVASITRVSLGVYKLALEDHYVDFISLLTDVRLAGGVGVKTQVVSCNPTSSGPNPQSVFLRVTRTLGTNTNQVETIQCAADTGAYAVSTVVVSDGATLVNGDFFVWNDVRTGLNYLFYYIINGVAPGLSGSAVDAVPAGRRVGISIASTATATDVANATKGVINSLLGADVTATSVTGTVTLTQKAFGVIVATTAFSVTSGSVGGRLTVADTNTGTASNLNGKYLLLYSALNAVTYYVWFNVNSQGVDPAVAGATAIPVALTTGASANAVATAVRAAIAAVSGSFSPVSVSTDTVTITLAAPGAANIPAAGTTSGFVFAITTPGSLIVVEFAPNVNNVVSYNFTFNDSSGVY